MKGRMNVNIREIALLAETSVATVSRVINMDEHVSEETRKRVLEIIESTGYKPNLVERALRGQRKGKIMVLLPTLADPYYSRVLEGVEHRARANDYDVLICSFHRDADAEKNYLGLVRTNQIDGVIVFSSSMPDEKLDAFASQYPLVQCGASAQGANISYTCIDNVAAAEEATNHLIQLGNERIALLTGNFGRVFEYERERGYKRALRNSNIPIDERYIAASDYNHHDGYEVCRKLMALDEPPTAFFCSCDTMACGVIKYVIEIGKTPGLDVDIIGFDGTYISELCTPSLTVIEQPAYEMGRASFDLLIERIRDKDVITKRVVMPYKLVKRQSTKKAVTIPDYSTAGTGNI